MLGQTISHPFSGQKPTRLSGTHPESREKSRRELTEQEGSSTKGERAGTSSMRLGNCMKLSNIKIK